MDILMSIHKRWADKIFNKTKTLEFRKSIGKDFKIGDIVYLYETLKNGGCKRVVGQFTIGNIEKIEGKSKVATYDFLLYYCKNIIKDNDAFNMVKKAFAINLPNYNNAIKLSYIYNIDFLESLRDVDVFPDLLKMNESQLKKYYENQERTKKLVNDCDKWLSSIGFYNEYGESNYRYYIEIKDVKKYNKQLELSSFINKKEEKITKAPQSWCYCTLEKIRSN